MTHSAIKAQQFHFALHCVKSVRILSFSGPYFPAFGPNLMHQLGLPHAYFFSEKLRLR